MPPKKRQKDKNQKNAPKIEKSTLAGSEVRFSTNMSSHTSSIQHRIGNAEMLPIYLSLQKTDRIQYVALTPIEFRSVQMVSKHQQAREESSAASKEYRT
jgi:hypothetical protein